MPNDPPGFVPIGQLSGAVYTAGQAQNITGNGSLSVTIDSPEEGSSSPGDIVDVVGTFTGPVNTGITINGIPAKTVNGRFMVPNVRLPKAGTIEAVATTLPGLTATASITLNHSGGKSIVRIDVEEIPKLKSTAWHAATQSRLFHSMPNNRLVWRRRQSLSISS